MSLSLKHQAFVDEYLKDRNATQAAIRAGYKPTNADVTGLRVLRNARVQEAIRVRTELASAVAGVDVAWVLQELQNTYTKAASLQDYAPAVKCLELLGKHLGMFTERHHHTFEPSEREARLAALFARN